MSTETDVMLGVRKMVDAIKYRLDHNLKTAVGNKMLTLDESKIPGLCKIMEDAVDQGFSEGTELLVNTLQALSRQNSKG